MTEIKAPEAQYINRRALLMECDRYIKSCESAERKQAVKEMAVWVMGAVTPDLRSDIKVSKREATYGVCCSHCGFTCGKTDLFCRHCGGRFV